MAALREARRVAGIVGTVPEVAAADAACKELIEGARACRFPAEDGCGKALVVLFAKLRALRGTLQPRRAAVADKRASDVFDVTSRVALARGALARGACADIGPEGAVASQMLLGPDGRSILVRPLVALRGGRRYAVIARGVPETALGELRGALVPHADGDGITVPPGSFTASISDLLPDDAGGISDAKLRDFVARLEHDADAVPGLGAFAGVRVTLPDVVLPEQVGRLQIAFAPVHEAREKETLAVYRVLDARRELLEDRAQLGGLDCATPAPEPRDVKQALGGSLPNVATLLHGSYRSLAVQGGASSGPFGVAVAAAQPLQLPYWLALPHGFGPDTPLVVAVDGHGGSAARMLAKHANALTGRGLAVLTVEQPRHGERTEPDVPYLDVLDPAALGRIVRQASVDVLAAVDFVTRCGLALPEGPRLHVAQVRLFGYSLGAVVGAIARSVEPRIGTTVLVAPGGDMLGWLALRIPVELGGKYVTCLGGSQEGESCMGSGQCAPPGVCAVDPFFERLQWILTLPYAIAVAPADPLSYVTHRTGTSSRGRLLMITGGEDAALHPMLATHLADAYGMQPSGAHQRRGPGTRFVQWPALAHDLIERPDVRAQIAAFLASNGRSVPPAEAPSTTTVPSWYRVGDVPTN